MIGTIGRGKHIDFALHPLGKCFKALVVGNHLKHIAGVDAVIACGGVDALFLSQDGRYQDAVALGEIEFHQRTAAPTRAGGDDEAGKVHIARG